VRTPAQWPSQICTPIGSAPEAALWIAAAYAACSEMPAVAMGGSRSTDFLDVGLPIAPAVANDASSSRVYTIAEPECLFDADFIREIVRQWVAHNTSAFGMSGFRSCPLDRAPLARATGRDFCAWSYFS